MAAFELCMHCAVILHLEGACCDVLSQSSPNDICTISQPPDKERGCVTGEFLLKRKVNPG